MNINLWTIKTIVGVIRHWMNHNPDESSDLSFDDISVKETDKEIVIRISKDSIKALDEMRRLKLENNSQSSDFTKAGFEYMTAMSDIKPFHQSIN